VAQFAFCATQKAPSEISKGAFMQSIYLFSQNKKDPANACLFQETL